MKGNRTTKAPAKKKNKYTSGVIRAVIPFLMLALALFFETCLILGESAGQTGISVRAVLLGIFGQAAHALCAAAILIAFFFKDLDANGTLRYKSVVASAAVLMIAVFNSLYMQNGLREATLDFVKFYEIGVSGKSGGAVGSFVGLLFSKLFTPAAATVVSAIAAAVLISFALGKSRLGLWGALSGGSSSAPKKKNTAKPESAKKPIPVPKVSPSRIDTVIAEDSSGVTLPRLEASLSALPELYGSQESVPDFTEADFNEINEASFNAVDFNEPEKPQRAYTPIDLMEEFGFREQQSTTVDVYDESPKPVLVPQREKVKKPGISYSPFATFRSEDEIFSRAEQPQVEAAPERRSVDMAYSPFADPMRSIEEKNSRKIENEAQIWEVIKREAPIEKKPSDDDEDMPLILPSSEPASMQFADISEAIQTVCEYVEPQEEGEEADDDDEITVTAEQIFASPVYEAQSSVPLRKGTAFDDDVDMPEQEEPSPSTRYEDEPDTRVKNPFGIYNKLRYPRYAKPSSDLLDPVDSSAGISEQEIYETQSKLHSVFENFHVDASVTGYSIGPSITRYEITPGPGVKAKQITGLGDDIALALQSEKRRGDIRIVTVPGKSVMGVEVPNSVVKKVSLRSLIENKEFTNAKSKITVCVGLTVSGKPIYMNIDDMPHVLVAGQTKSGKSVAINCMIISLIYRASPDEVQLILIDPKRVELSIYNDIPHMVMPVIDDPKRAAAALKWAVAEMERRYQLLNDARVCNRDEYYATRDQNPKFEYMPQIVIIIDELADLMLQVREHVEGLINRLAAMARACGMHIVIGTQRPSVDVVTGLIKANIPSHISFKVSSHTDSRVILGNVGAEKLLGRGDMLYHPTGSNQIRAQGAFVDTPEIKRVLNYVIEKNGKAEYDPEVMYALQTETDKLNKVERKTQGDDDYAVDSSDIDFELLCQATELILNMGGGISKNIIQRHLKIGFNRSANIFDKLEELGFISPPQGNKPRDVTVTWEQYQQWRNNNGR